MGLAFAAFHWTPAAWSQSTPHEFWAAYEAYRAMNRAPNNDNPK